MFTVILIILAIALVPALAVLGYYLFMGGLIAKSKLPGSHVFWRLLVIIAIVWVLIASINALGS